MLKVYTLNKSICLEEILKCLPFQKPIDNWIVCIQGFTDDQLMLVEQNTVLVEEREREIRQIVQSISDLNEIFRDLAGMVVEQVFKTLFTFDV